MNNSIAQITNITFKDDINKKFFFIKNSENSEETAFLEEFINETRIIPPLFGRNYTYKS